MKIPMYQIDAFTTDEFKGNPAAVCFLQAWLTDELMQNIAKENNLAETAFCIVKEDFCELRWFTPEEEIDLCGHGTLATAYAIFKYIKSEWNEVKFTTQSGVLEVTKGEERLIMTFPSTKGEAYPISEEFVDALGKRPLAFYKARDYMAVYESEEEIIKLNPNIEKLKALDVFGIIVTARGKVADFVSRYFAPTCSVSEDPVTGSAHCTLIPYWREILGKEEFIAYQLSERGGVLYCKDLGDRTEISGQAVTYLEGFIYV